MRATQGAVEFYTFEEYAALLAAAERLDQRILAGVLLGGDAGLRAGEVMALEQPVLRAWMARAQRVGGLKASGNFHILRHTFCSHLAMRGAPAKVIQELAGHVHLPTAMRYMHLSPGHKEQAIRLLNRRPMQFRWRP